jgi:hypothetical protein
MHGLRAEPAGRDDPTVNAPQRLRTYQEILSSLGRLVHTCPNCRQRAHDHGAKGNAPHECCWFCDKQDKKGRDNRNVLHWSNGLDLDVGCVPLGEEPPPPEASVEERDAWAERGLANEKATLHQTLGGTAEAQYWADGARSSISWADRDEWRRLQAKHGPLRPLEEALVCRVTACTSVLKLPSERQLGYRGNVINFTNNIALVARQLPLAPKDSGFIIYRVPRRDGSSSLEKVRKWAIFMGITYP